MPVGLSLGQANYNNNQEKKILLNIYSGPDTALTLQ